LSDPHPAPILPTADLRALRRFDKPIVVTEFGCCAYEGAEDTGGSAYGIVDSGPPSILRSAKRLSHSTSI